MNRPIYRPTEYSCISVKTRISRSAHVYADSMDMDVCNNVFLWLLGTARCAPSNPSV